MISTFHDKLPSGSFKCMWSSEFYMLLPRKKRMYIQNRILRPDLRHLLFSRYARVFYERIIDETTLEDNLLYYLKQGILYMWPDEDTIEEIREEMTKEDLSYRELMWRRNAEIEYEVRLKGKPTGNGDRYFENYFRTEYQKYLKTKKP